MPYCTVCNVSVDNRRWSSHLRTNVHKNSSTTLLHDNVSIINSSFKGRISSYRITATNEQTNTFPEMFLNSVKVYVKTLIDQLLIKHTSVKINFELFSYFLLFKNDQQELKSFATKNFVIPFYYNFDFIYKSVVEILTKKIEEFEHRDSGWTFLSNSHLEVNINKHQTLSGSRFIPLPTAIKNKKA